MNEVRTKQVQIKKDNFSSVNTVNCSSTSSSETFHSRHSDTKHGHIKCPAFGKNCTNYKCLQDISKCEWL